jgi:hypothetical protein
MAVDNSCTRITGEESEHPPLTSCSQNSSLLKNRKSGQLICYKTGQFYLLLTGVLCIEKQGLAMRLGKEGGAAAALLRNQLVFWSSHPSRRHFLAQFRQTSPARLF